ncbi:hypothetical protein HBI56_226580 [Parastagonospora nodorum]|uniref:Uncharacterized protein n=2 Tax=Phaeosphaeria nodorum (strain SN15 / ATCC MYA-4574 / FGSC 10173) TaxID=321614 RepID=A0A7U2EZH7_PHANO|nr:hypothetical protein SNOG_15886 [Parastagonospora nodorum SN15]KAH3904859.1 hypothetical protein HBH56_226960 [Parastagonospora nodorum]EAT76724.1 hypothetical protein SNOG_15886 [Parastagonospora nodorum SN15]KAH3921680.1 hypothetical protein HBH54_235850 [Parastagonospora nodorum]KAH3959002.1 hypothetical protein HBH51_202840 [Parastagonospora nodorum]KAH3963553.1 hypothetical protein HBH52_216910 [Parastagonospora nodorum]
MKPTEERATIAVEVAALSAARPRQTMPFPSSQPVATQRPGPQAAERHPCPVDAQAIAGYPQLDALRQAPPSALAWVKNLFACLRGQSSRDKPSPSAGCICSSGVYCTSSPMILLSAPNGDGSPALRPRQTHGLAVAAARVGEVLAWAAHRDALWLPTGMACPTVKG